MQWTDDAIVLGSRKHGETSAIVTLITRTHGVHAGLVRGGGGKRGRARLQPGTFVTATWRARLADHLGSYVLEATSAPGAAFLDDPDRLACLSAACAVCQAALPERQPHEAAYLGLSALLETLADETWASGFVKWEMGLLAELGFGLDLGSCAATGVTDNLTHVSPKTGRAVSAEAAKPYLKSLLALPAFLLEPGGAGPKQQVLDGLRLTAFFMERHVYGPLGRKAPPARGRLIRRLAEY